MIVLRPSALGRGHRSAASRGAYGAAYLQHPQTPRRSPWIVASQNNLLRRDVAETAFEQHSGETVVQQLADAANLRKERRFVA
jgi:hypothetical protein